MPLQPLPLPRLHVILKGTTDNFAPTPPLDVALHLPLIHADPKWNETRMETQTTDRQVYCKNTPRQVISKITSAERSLHVTHICASLHHFTHNRKDKTASLICLSWICCADRRLHHSMLIFNELVKTTEWHRAAVRNSLFLSNVLYTLREMLHVNH